MASKNGNNTVFEKTSFLGNNSSEFVETLYAEYLKNPEKLSEEWRKFFEGLNDFGLLFWRKQVFEILSDARRLKTIKKTLLSNSEILEPTINAIGTKQPIPINFGSWINMLDLS